LLGAASLSCQAAPAEEPPRPKYGQQARRLFLDREYLREHEAADFWALMGYYLPQRNDSSCSLASAVMVLNALRAAEALSAADEMVTQESLLRRVGSPAWTERTADGGPGVSLDQFAELLEQALGKYEIEGRVEVAHIERDDEDALRNLREVLAANEASAGDFLIANFLQSEFTGDPEGAVGHMAPVAAYDAEAGRVLLFDPDRRWYEPYWVTVETLLAGMATRDAEGGSARGYLRVIRED
jgi:hypothetical protein